MYMRSMLEMTSKPRQGISPQWISIILIAKARLDKEFTSQ